MGSWSLNRGSPWQQTVPRTLDQRPKWPYGVESLRYQLKALAKYGLWVLKLNPVHPIVPEVEVHLKWWEGAEFVHLLHLTTGTYIVWKVCPVAEWLLMWPLDGREYRFLTTAAGSTYAPVYLSLSVSKRSQRGTKPNHPTQKSAQIKALESCTMYHTIVVLPKTKFALS